MRKFRLSTKHRGPNLIDYPGLSFVKNQYNHQNSSNLFEKKVYFRNFYEYHPRIKCGEGRTAKHEYDRKLKEEKKLKRLNDLENQLNRSEGSFESTEDDFSIETSSSSNLITNEVTKTSKVENKDEIESKKIVYTRKRNNDRINKDFFNVLFSDRKSANIENEYKNCIKTYNQLNSTKQIQAYQLESLKDNFENLDLKYDRLNQKYKFVNRECILIEKDIEQLKTNYMMIKEELLKKNNLIKENNYNPIYEDIPFVIDLDKIGNLKKYEKSYDKLNFCINEDLYNQKEYLFNHKESFNNENEELNSENEVFNNKNENLNNNNEKLENQNFNKNIKFDNEIKDKQNLNIQKCKDKKLSIINLPLIKLNDDIKELKEDLKDVKNKSLKDKNSNKSNEMSNENSKKDYIKIYVDDVLDLLIKSKNNMFYEKIKQLIIDNILIKNFIKRLKFEILNEKRKNQITRNGKNNLKIEFSDNLDQLKPLNRKARHTINLPKSNSINKIKQTNLNKPINKFNNRISVLNVFEIPTQKMEILQMKTKIKRKELELKVNEFKKMKENLDKKVDYELKILEKSKINEKSYLEENKLLSNKINQLKFKEKQLLFENENLLKKVHSLTK